MPACLIAYDVGQIATRNALAKRLEKAGRRIQKSVYLIELSAPALQRLAQELQGIIAAQDRLLILPLCGRCLAKGRFYGPQPPQIMII